MNKWALDKHRKHLILFDAFKNTKANLLVVFRQLKKFILLIS